MKKLFIEVCSDLDYENMTVDISSEEGRFATLDCDNGIDHPMISFFSVKTGEKVFEIDFNEFSSALAAAQKKLKDANQ